MSKLAHLPVGLFGAAMSLAALCGAWRLAHVMWVTPIFISEAIGALAVIAFIAMVTAYALKMTRHPARALAEFRHPVQGPLFATFFIALLLLPIVLYPYMLGFAQAMWCVGAALMLGFTTLIVHRWLNQQQGIAQVEDFPDFARGDLGVGQALDGGAGGGGQGGSCH